MWGTGEHKVWADLGIMDSQGKMLEWSVVALNREFDKDMKVLPRKCRAADEKFTKNLSIMDGIQARTTLLRS